LVRLNSLASSSSPQGALLAAATGLQKTNQTPQAAPVVDSGDAATDGTVAPLQNEMLVKNAGEHQVREMLLNPDSESTRNKVTTQAGMNSKQGVFFQSQESDGQNPISSGKGVDVGKEVPLAHKDPAKGTLIASGKESAQWVPYAGATSPQVPLGAEAPPRGVFIPMDRLVREAGAALEKGAGKVQMTLQPPSLGKINMEVVVQNNRVELVLTANHADVQQILQANADQLKNALNNQGFQVDQMSVLLRRENFGFNLGGNPLWQDGSGRQQGNGNGSSASPPAPDVEHVIPRWDSGTGTISIFA
jgi:flagellar hook-length control protein FliK